MPRVVGLDLSLTRTGICLPDGSATLLRPKTKGCERMVEIRNEVIWFTGHADLVFRADPRPPRCDIVAIEGFAYGRPNKAHDIGGIGWIIRVALHEAGIKYVEIPPTVLKRYATGKGNAGKPDMLAAAIRRLDYLGSDDNEADAMWLHALAMDAYGDPVVTMPQAQRDAAVKALSWPRLTKPAPT